MKRTSILGIAALLAAGIGVCLDGLAVSRDAPSPLPELPNTALLDEALHSAKSPLRRPH